MAGQGGVPALGDAAIQSLCFQCRIIMRQVKVRAQTFCSLAPNLGLEMPLSNPDRRDVAPGGLAVGRVGELKFGANLLSTLVVAESGVPELLIVLGEVDKEVGSGWLLRRRADPDLALAANVSTNAGPVSGSSS